MFDSDVMMMTLHFLWYCESLLCSRWDGMLVPRGHPGLAYGFPLQQPLEALGLGVEGLLQGITCSIPYEAGQGTIESLTRLVQDQAMAKIAQRLPAMGAQSKRGIDDPGQPRKLGLHMGDIFRREAGMKRILWGVGIDGQGQGGELSAQEQAESLCGVLAGQRGQRVGRREKGSGADKGVPSVIEGEVGEG